MPGQPERGPRRARSSNGGVTPSRAPEVARDRSTMKEESPRGEADLCSLLVSSVEGHAIFTMDSEGRITSWNPGAAKLFGYSWDEARGMPFSRLFPPEAIESGEPERELSAAPVAGRVEDITWHLRKDGTRFWGSGFTTALRDSAGRLIGYGKILRDLTPHKQVEARLQLLQAVVAHANDAVLLTEPAPLDAPGPRIEYVNEAFTRMTGYSAEEAVGRDPRFLQGPATDPEATARIRSGLEEGRPVRAELVNYRKDGGEFWVELSIVPVRDDAGRITHWGSVQRETTERRRAEEDQRRQARILELAHDSIILRSLDDRVTSWNRGAKDLYGWTAAEVVGRDLHALLHTVFPGPSERIRASLLREGRWEGELRQATREGRQITVASRWSLWRDEAGEPTGILEINRDISDRKRAEDRLRRSEERLRTTLEQLPIGVWFTDETGRLVYGNPAARRIWAGARYTSPEHFGEYKGWWLDTGERIEADEWAVARAISRREASLDEEVEIEAFDGTHKILRNSAVPLIGPDGELHGAVIVNEDITERKRAETERERLLAREREARAEADRRARDEAELRDELAQVMESRIRLVRGFSHDVKNPLGAADGYLELLEQGVMDELTARQKESVEQVRRSLSAALRLIDDLVELARAEAGRLEIEREPVDVAAVVRAVAEEARARIEGKGLRMTVRVDRDLPRTESDGARIRQILGNLLSNAAKYTEEGGVTVTAEVRESASAPAGGRWIAITVRDTGRGIPPEERKALFREFERIESGREQGAGLGLAISQRIAHLLGGDITVESEVGHGSTFTLWLPLDGDRRP